MKHRKHKQRHSTTTALKFDADVEEFVRSLRAAQETAAVAAPVAELPVMPSADFLAVDAMTRAAQGAGWPGPDAFIAACVLKMHGTPVQDAVAMFRHAGRWTQ
jgi:hypothetical protein